MQWWVKIDGIALVSILHIINDNILNFSTGTKMLLSAKVNKNIYF